ncbi:MAG: type I restriction endonuclease [Thermodesulfobacteriota bacterium]
MNGLLDGLRELGFKVQRDYDKIKNEEATKAALILPFIRCLGYDVHDPSEVVPEVVPKGFETPTDKIDLSIMVSGKHALIIECKPIQRQLDTKDYEQLKRYFQMSSEAKVGILTNGVQYHFYASTEKAGQMDATPFFVLDLTDLEDEWATRILSSLCKGTFKQSAPINSDWKVVHDIKRYMLQHLQNPSLEFAGSIAGGVYPDKKVMASTKDTFQRLIPDGVKLAIRDIIWQTKKEARKGSR